MDKLTTFIRRLKKIGIEVELTGNVPWIYISSINEKRVTENFQSDWGFVVGYYNKEFTFENTREIFKLLKKYK